MDEIISISVTLLDNEISLDISLDTVFGSPQASFDFETANPTLISS